MNNKHTSVKTYVPYHGKDDPCPSIGKKFYFAPPHLYMGFQPPNLPQYSPKEALQKGTLWPAFYDYYENPYKSGGRKQ
jgi:spore coat protein JA